MNISLERAGIFRVKTTMIAVRLLLVSLWPILWLLGPAQVHAGVEPPVVSLPAISICGNAHPDGWNFTPTQTHDRHVLRSNRRYDRHLGPSGAQTGPSQSRTGMFSFQSLSGIQSDLQVCLGLARGWQFHWRTALNPRAPSLLS